MPPWRRLRCDSSALQHRPSKRRLQIKNQKGKPYIIYDPLSAHNLDFLRRILDTTAHGLVPFVNYLTKKYPKDFAIFFVFAIIMHLATLIFYHQHDPAQPAGSFPSSMIFPHQHDLSPPA